jgi:hypothetical protein
LSATASSAGALVPAFNASGITRIHPHFVPPIVPKRTDEHREVLITARTPSALVSVDGSSPEPVGFGVRKSLALGSHAFTFTVDPDNKCCQAVIVTKEIMADDGTGPQAIVGALPFRPATLSLVGPAPSDARLRCPLDGIDIGPGTERTVRMETTERLVSCFLQGGGLMSPESKVVTLHPGSPTIVKWPTQP